MINKIFNYIHGRFHRFLESSNYKKEIYKSFEEAKDMNNVESFNWFNKNLKNNYVKNFLDSKNNKISNCSFTASINHLISLINTLCLKKEIKVLDYGGAAGSMFVMIRNYLLKPNSINRHVYDKIDYSVYIKEINDFNELKFIKYEETFKGYNIIFMYSVINLIDNFDKLLKDLLSVNNAEYGVLGLVASGRNESYALFNKKLNHPVHIMNEQKLIKLFEKLSYSCVINACENAHAHFLKRFPKKFHINESNQYKFYVFKYLH